MPFKIHNLRVKNFKCFDSRKYYKIDFDVDKTPSILSGPNGFGKTTFFDAIELIFTKKITRLQTSIERQNANLNKNILINEAKKDGYIIVELVNENYEYLTLISIVDHTLKKLDFTDSIKYTLYKGTLSDNVLDEFISNVENWKTSIKEFNELNYSMEHFNVFYYVSQAESVHFLKNSINERKDAMNVLLNTKNVDSHIEYLEKKLIGKNIRKTGVIVNDEIKRLEKLIDDKANYIKSKINDESLSINAQKYKALLQYPDGVSPTYWDVDLKNSKDGEKIIVDVAIQEIEALASFVKNRSDYYKYLSNSKIQKYIDNEIIINDYIEYNKYLEDGVIDKVEILSFINNLNKKIKLYNLSKFFRKDYDYIVYDEKDLKAIQEIDSNIVNVDIAEITKIINSIKSISSSLSEKQSALKKVSDARIKLNKMMHQYDNKSSNCPYCNHPYTTALELESAYDGLSEILEKEKNTDSKKKQAYNDKLKEILEEDQKLILGEINDLNEETVGKYNDLSDLYNRFVKDHVRIKSVEEVSNLILIPDGFDDLEVNEKKTVLKRLLSKKKNNYSNIEFEMLNKKFDYSSIQKKYSTVLDIEQPMIIDDEHVSQKKKYLKYMDSIEKNNDIVKLKEDLRQEIIKLKKVESARDKLDQLRNLYQTAITKYKNEVLDKLRIPLLIYTGKILQDYQNGLGVFISKDEMRFVSNGDAKHDILNTFSSGQLSGFVLAFLFSMNKQYINPALDDVGFILVDDPVQTMDDINITSLIEVLRNDFSDKQIILSTHEADKENYILYKFLKYNFIGQSFNVQEKLYG
ncbi:exonuclease SbcC [Dethiosulfatibacter aminovorans DSM 17477]|uniref:Exonuclease SbcC n=1 Tax=Dethiosulfatibacter aminovorans DSM 17477 TaxID=1121476 RepID=A0A1M6MEH9_9FIRM|nr:AAA family ATPase [Dethiosulfatibacter aminovorans]SHJ81818.1 exonuclease SbcC [Dethiosulfatibacter aminovorans DSM 17477]